MRGMVLAAGRGERMGPLTLRMAKPAIPALNRPLLSYPLELLRRGGVREAAVNLHHLPDTVESVVKGWTPAGMKVTLFREETLLGTAGGLKNASSVLAGEGPFFLSNGDFVLDVEPADVLETHRKAGAAATMVLLPLQEHKGYQPVEVVDGRVVRIAGYPDHDTPKPVRYTFSGLHVVDPSVLDRIPEDEEFDINRQVYPGLIGERETIAAHIVDGPWAEVGTPGDYLRRTLRLLSPPFQGLFRRLGIRPDGENDQPVLLGEDVKIPESAALRDGMILGDRVTLGRDVNPLVWTREEFEQRRASADHFLANVLSEPTIMIVGEAVSMSA